MNLQKFTVKAQEAVQSALEIAQSKNQQGIEPAHLLKAFLQDEGGLVPTLLSRLQANADTLAALADRAVDKLPTVTGASVSGQYVGSELNKTFDRALKEAESLGDDYVASEHLLMAMAEGDGAVANALQSQGVTKDRAPGGAPRGEGRPARPGPLRRVQVRRPQPLRARPQRGRARGPASTR